MGEDRKETIEIVVNAEVDSAVGYLHISRHVDKVTAKKILQLILPKVSKIKTGRTRAPNKKLTPRQEELLALQDR